MLTIFMLVAGAEIPPDEESWEISDLDATGTFVGGGQYSGSLVGASETSFGMRSPLGFLHDYNSLSKSRIFHIHTKSEDMSNEKVR